MKIDVLQSFRRRTLAGLALITCLLVICATAARLTQTPAQPQAGTWHGTIDLPSAGMRLVLRIQLERVVLDE